MEWTWDEPVLTAMLFIHEKSDGKAFYLFSKSFVVVLVLLSHANSAEFVLEPA